MSRSTRSSHRGSSATRHTVLIARGRKEPPWHRYPYLHILSAALKASQGHRSTHSRKTRASSTPRYPYEPNHHNIQGQPKETALILRMSVMEQTRKSRGLTGVPSALAGARLIVVVNICASVLVYSARLIVPATIARQADIAKGAACHFLVVVYARNHKGRCAIFQTWANIARLLSVRKYGQYCENEPE